MTDLVPPHDSSSPDSSLPDSSLPDSSSPASSDPSIPWARVVPLARPAGVIPDVPLAAMRHNGPPAWPVPTTRGNAAVDLLLFATFFIVAELASVILNLLPTTADPRWQQVAMSGAIGCASLCACILIVFMRGHGAASIGWTGRHFFANIAIGIGALILLYIACMALVLCIMLIMPELLAGPSTAQQAIEATFPPMRPSWVVSMMLFVALWEEVAFRGLVLTRTFALLRRWWLAIPVASVIFGLPHYYQGPVAVVFTTILGAIMACLFVWRRSLVPAITLHWLHDVIFFLLLGSMSTTWE